MHENGEGKAEPRAVMLLLRAILGFLGFVTGRMKSRVRQKEQNRTKCRKAGDCEAEEERDGKVLEEPGCHRTGENTAMEMWSVLTLLQQSSWGVGGISQTT